MLNETKPSIAYRIKKLFNAILKVLGITRNGDLVRTLFNKIRKGEFSKYKPSKSVLEDFEKRFGGTLYYYVPGVEDKELKKIASIADATTFYAVVDSLNATVMDTFNISSIEDLQSLPKKINDIFDDILTTNLELGMYDESQEQLIKDVINNKEVFKKQIDDYLRNFSIIKKNTEYYKEMFRNAPEIPISKHPNIRSVAACYSSSQLAIRMASLAGARLHVLHVSTAKELQLFSDAPLEDKHITAEACIAHLLYRQQDYKELGTRIKCNPSIKKQADRDALRNAVNTGVIDVIATDHAPHLLSEKEGGALKAMSGMPMIQFSLVSMLELAEKGIFSIETIVEKMCHAPAQIYGICNRGYIREGYQADLVLVSHGERWEVNTENILSKCGWSPLDGNSFRWKVEKTFANGHLIYSDGQVDDTYRGEELRFDY